jgi:hypothetical protein
MTTTVRPRLQDLVKQALAEGAARAEVGRRREAETCEACGKEKAACSCGAKSAEHAQKLAAAIEHIADILVKEGELGPGEGPGTLDVSEAEDAGAIPHAKGQSRAQPPPATTQKGLPTEQGATQMKNDRDAPPAQGKTQKTASVASDLRAAARAREGKTAGVPLRELLRRTKVAEDAQNPARITAGKAPLPPVTEAGQPGGPSPEGADAVSSSERARNLTKREAKARPKRDLAAYLEEPAQSGQTDKTLDMVFDHAREAGTKFAYDDAMKTAAARVLLRTLVAETEGTAP